MEVQTLGSIGADKGQEKLRTLNIANLLKTFIINNYKDVEVTVEQEKNTKGNWTRTNRNGFDFALSIHFNAFNEEATGTETYYKISSNKFFADNLSSNLSQAMNIINRGGKITNGFRMLNIGFNILTEICFHDNQKDLTCFNNNLDKVVQALGIRIGSTLGLSTNITNQGNFSYKAHIQDIGWENEKTNWDYSGTEKQSRRVEAIIINGLDCKYRVHMEGLGWGPFVEIGQVAGTTGQSRRIEAIEIQANREIIGQAHIQNEGWTKEVRGKNIIIGTTRKKFKIRSI